MPAKPDFLIRRWAPPDEGGVEDQRPVVCNLEVAGARQQHFRHEEFTAVTAVPLAENGKPRFPGLGGDGTKIGIAFAMPSNHAQLSAS